MMKESFVSLVKSYNLFVQKVSELHMEEASRSEMAYWEIPPLVVDEESWLSTACEELGETPAELLAREFPAGSLSEEEVLEYYRYGALQMIYHMPMVVEQWLVDLGAAGEAFLISLLESDVVCRNVYDGFQDETDRDATELYYSAVRTARLYPQGAVKQALMKSYTRCVPSNQMFLEAITDTLICYQEEELVIACLDEADPITEKEVNLAQALVSMGRQEDSIYQCLRRTFKRAGEEKRYLAMMLADYGDNRAVPLLRKYAKDRITAYQNAPAESPEEKKEQQGEIFMILNMIESLGGQTDDLTQGMPVSM